MKFNFNNVLVDLRGQIISDTDGVVTMGRLACLALLEVGQVPSDEKYKRFDLAKKILSSVGFMDISIEEAAFLKIRVGEYGSTLVAGRFGEFIDNPVVTHTLEEPVVEACKHD